MRKLVMLIILSAGLVFPFPGAKAQTDAAGYYLDAIRFSQSSTTGTARSMAMGGANVALGGDMSSILSNPAGLGVFNRSSFSLSTAFNGFQAYSKSLGQSNNESKATLMPSNMGIVFNRSFEKNGWRVLNFGVGYARLQNLNTSTFYQHTNNDNSIIDMFLEQADGFLPSELSLNSLPGMAYENYLIGPESILAVNPGPDDIYFTDAVSIPSQSETIATRGSQGQWTFAIGANYKDKVYVGGNLGFTNITFESSKKYDETFEDGPLIDMGITEQLEIDASGINAGLGIIVKPFDIIRIGASVTSPTLYQVSDIYTADMSTNWDNYLYEDAVNGDVTLNDVFSESDALVSDYTLTTPMKFNAGAAFFIKKMGFVTADAEYINYGKAHLNHDCFDANSGDCFSMADDNSVIARDYKGALNLKLGGEFRYNIFRFRGGYAIHAAAEKDNNAWTTGRTVLSGGVGLRLKAFYLDFALASTGFKQEYRPYVLANNAEPVVRIDNNINNGTLTFGFSF